MKIKVFFNVEMILTIIFSLFIGIYFIVCFIDAPESVTVFNVSIVAFVWLLCSFLFGLFASTVRDTVND